MVRFKTLTPLLTLSLVITLSTPSIARAQAPATPAQGVAIDQAKLDTAPGSMRLFETPRGKADSLGSETATPDNVTLREAIRREAVRQAQSAPPSPASKPLSTGAKIGIIAAIAGIVFGLTYWILWNSETIGG